MEDLEKDMEHVMIADETAEVSQGEDDFHCLRARGLDSYNEKKKDPSKVVDVRLG